MFLESGTTWTLKPDELINFHMDLLIINLMFLLIIFILLNTLLDSCGLIKFTMKIFMLWKWFLDDNRDYFPYGLPLKPDELRAREDPNWCLALHRLERGKPRWCRTSCGVSQGNGDDQQETRRKPDENQTKTIGKP